MALRSGLQTHLRPLGFSYQYQKTGSQSLRVAHCFDPARTTSTVSTLESAATTGGQPSIAPVRTV